MDKNHVLAKFITDQIRVNESDLVEIGRQIRSLQDKAAEKEYLIFALKEKFSEKNLRNEYVHRAPLATTALPLKDRILRLFTSSTETEGLMIKDVFERLRGSLPESLVPSYRSVEQNVLELLMEHKIEQTDPNAQRYRRFRIRSSDSSNSSTRIYPIHNLTNYESRT